MELSVELRIEMTLLSEFTLLSSPETCPCREEYSELKDEI